MKTSYLNKIKNTAIRSMAVFTLVAAGCSMTAKAQLNPMGSQYFINQYEGNPAMAGLREGLFLNLGFRKQWSTIPGSPKTQSITADYQAGRKVGLGLNLYNDAAGLIKRTRVVGTYAYHLPLNNEAQKIHFGISLGFMNERIQHENVNGDQDDNSIGRFNQRQTYLDGDFGAAYTTNRVTVQGAVPNMKSFLGRDKNNSADHSTYYTALSYKFDLGSGSGQMQLEPKAAYRGINGYKNVIDLGAKLAMINNQVNFTGMYHSSQNATFGLGLDFRELSILGMYSTQTAVLSGYTGGNFEIGLKYNFLPKK